MTNKLLHLTLVAASLCIFGRCSQNISGVETTNGFSVTATSESIRGTVPANTQIFLFDTSYIPFIDSGIGIGTTADNDGYFQVSARPGTYNVLIINFSDGCAGVVNQTVGGEPSSDTGSTQTRYLEKTGSLNGSVTAPENKTILVYLSGLCYYRLLTGSGDFVFNALPAGTYQIRYALISNTEPPVFELEDEQPIAVASGKAATAKTVTIE